MLRSAYTCRASLILVLLLAGSLLSPLTSRAGSGLEGVHSFSHVVVLVLENENFSDTWDPAKAPYLNSLKGNAVFADRYYATGHASLDNYIAMMSGQPDQPITGTDCDGGGLARAVTERIPGGSFLDPVAEAAAQITNNFWSCVQGQSLMANGRNFADQLEENGISWKGYMDGMPEPCFHAPYDPTDLRPDPYQGNSRQPPAYDYADRHNPFIYFDDIVGDHARCQAHVRPYTELAGDLAYDTLPPFAFITPDTCHDGHDNPCSNGLPGGLTSADLWLHQEVPALLTYLNAHDGALIITLDENGFTDTSNPPGCCSGGLGGVLPGFGGRIGLLALGAGITQSVVSTPYDHMSLLRTLEDSFGISEHLNNAAMASAMSDVL
ncbi:MAG: alkaline phosphatase family protein [Actinomycetota bacterium]|nr:alkaline phosphatase family protein [Actinomycetota bacterium]